MAAKSNIVSFLALILVSAFSPNAFPAFLVIENNSFESASLSEGSWNYTVPDWTITGDAGSFNGTGAFSSIPDGSHTAWVHSGSITQILGDTLTANSTYQLSVDIGHANNTGFVGYGVELWAGSTLLAADNSSLGDPGFGNWLTTSITYSVQSGDPLLGQALSVKLIGLGVETNFDNVMLEVTSVPVPAAIWLFGAGLLCLTGISGKNKSV